MSCRAILLPLAQFLSLGIIIHASAARADEAATALPPRSAFVAASRTAAPASREAQATLEQRKAERDEAVIRLLPSLSASASYTRNQFEAAAELPAGGGTQRIVITPRDQLDATLRVDVRVFDLPAYFRIRSTEASVDAAGSTALATDRDVERAVTQAFWERVGADAVVRAAERALSVAEENERVVRARRDAEIASDLDWERARAAIDRARQTLAEAKLSKGLATRKLESLTGLDASGKAPELEADLGRTSPVASYLRLAPYVPSVRAKEADVFASEVEEEAEWLRLVPTVSAFAQERFSNATGFAGEVATWSMGVTATWSLDPAAVASARTRAASRQVAEARAARTLSEAEDSIQDAWLEVQARREAAKAARSEERAAKRGASVAKEQYAASKVSQLDVIVADRDAFQAEVARIEADANLALARGLLDIASLPERSEP